MHIHPLVTETDTLAALCQRAGGGDSIAVDTEFLRENSYYPELCLIQVATADEAFAIDPLAEGLDLSPFLDLLGRHSLLKVVHAGGQDIEIFVHLTGGVPAPLFDTQVAAMALGMGEQISYQNLVQHFTGQQIDKGARFTDWARRPLSDRQLRYAIGDVTYLAHLFPKMLADLRKTGRGEWLDDEMARLQDTAHYKNDPEEAWLRLKHPSRKPDVLGRLKALARWREIEAEAKNVPRGRIVKDEALADIAAAPPATQQDLVRFRGLSASWATNAIGGRLMAALAAARPLLPDEIPPKEHQALSGDAALVATLLKLLLKIRARESGVAPRLLARSEEVDALASGHREGLAILEGWRRQLFGADALALVEGRIGFSVANNRLRMRALKPEAGNKGDLPEAGITAPAGATAAGAD